MRPAIAYRHSPPRRCRRPRALLLGALILLVAGLGSCAQPDGRPTLTAASPANVALTAAPEPTAALATAATVAQAATTAAPATTTMPPTSTVIPTATVIQTATVIPTSTVAATSTPDPYAELTIDALAAREYGGGLLEIVDTLETTESFTRYLIKYPSDGLDIYGFMNVPIEGDNFPIALVLHGYIDPAEYEVVPYTRRYADALAEAGYFVIHPNFRNYPPSDAGPDPFRIGYATDVLNLIAIIRAQSQDPLGTLRRADADNIHLWGHSMGGGVALRVIAVNTDPYLKAAVLYGSMSGDEALNYGRIREWTNNRRGRFELDAPPDALAAISPSSHLERLQAAVAVHHSRADDVVPVEWSEQLCAQLADLAAAGEIAGPPECYFYDGQPHTFRGSGDTLFMERTLAFFGTH